MTAIVTDRDAHLMWIEGIAKKHAERVRELEAVLMARPEPDCVRSKMIEWYKRIDALLVAQ